MSKSFKILCIQIYILSNALFFFERRARRLSAAASEDMFPIVERTSAIVVYGNSLPSESISSWMLMIRRPYWLQRSRKAPSSRVPRMALLNLLMTMVSLWAQLPSSIRHCGRSFSCVSASSMMVSQQKSFIHFLSCSRFLNLSEQKI